MPSDLHEPPRGNRRLGLRIPLRVAVLDSGHTSAADLLDRVAERGAHSLPARPRQHCDRAPAAAVRGDAQGTRGGDADGLAIEQADEPVHLDVAVRRHLPVQLEQPPQWIVGVQRREIVIVGHQPDRRPARLLSHTQDRYR